MNRDFRFALLLATYKRLCEGQLQIFKMLNQSYENFHLFVAVKGCSEYVFNKSWLPYFQKFIDEGKLTLRRFPNKNQMSNLVDCVRGLNLRGYDYFCKIDDDDFYDVNYLKRCNEAANESSGKNLFWMDRSCRLVVNRHDNFYRFKKNTQWNSYWGPTLCATRFVWQEYMNLENGEEDLPSYIGKNNLPAMPRHKDCGFHEDKLLYSMMRAFGGVYNIRKNGIPYVMFNESNASVSRGGFVNGWFQTENSDVTKSELAEEQIFYCKTPDFEDDVRVFMGYVWGVASGATGKLISLTDTELEIDWDKFLPQKYTRQDDGSWWSNDPI